jgi:hypothetical protein
MPADDAPGSCRAAQPSLKPPHRTLPESHAPRAPTWRAGGAAGQRRGAYGADNPGGAK